MSVIPINNYQLSRIVDRYIEVLPEMHTCGDLFDVPGYAYDLSRQQIGQLLRTANLNEYCRYAGTTLDTCGYPIAYEYLPRVEPCSDMQILKSLWCFMWNCRLLSETLDLNSVCFGQNSHSMICKYVLDSLPDCSLEHPQYSLLPWILNPRNAYSDSGR